MKHHHVMAALLALGITAPLALIFAFATGFSTKLAVIAVILFAVLWVILVGRRPNNYDTPPSPDEHSRGFW